MDSNPHIQRTADGYKLDTLEAIGLTPRASHALLLSATGHTATSAAQVMGCSANNVDALLATLRHKTNSKRKTDLITAAFINGWLRITTALLAAHIGVCASIPIQSSADDQPLRPRNSSRIHRRVRKGDWLWDDELNQFFQA